MSRSKEQPAWVIQQVLDCTRFRCCGNEDLHLFRCVYCEHPMALCCECDTAYPQLPDTSALTVPNWTGWNCPQCNALLTGSDFTTAESFIPIDDWVNYGLESFLSMRPTAELFAMVTRSSETLLDYLQRNMQSTAKHCAHDIARLADAIAHCYPGASEARKFAYSAAQARTRTDALAESIAIADPVHRAYAILGIADSLKLNRNSG